MRKILIPMTLALFVGFCAEPASEIRQREIPFNTYPFSDPDPVPDPDAAIYPYFTFDGYSKQSSPTEWNVVELENEFIKVQIMPSIGGKVWGAVEKSTGNEFIYANDVVKFRNIALRGPWTSGGIEFNVTLVGHTAAVSTPVDYKMRENDDGSVSCFVGGLDLISRTRWETEVRLEPGKAYFTTTTRWTNPTPLFQPYYQWSNAAYAASDDLQIFFPGTHYLGHDGQAHTWPVDHEEVDLSWYINNAPLWHRSYHVLGRPEGFYAAYWHDKGFGSGHYAPYDQKSGKKVWFWSQARDGEIWVDLLTDSKGQYVELQSGRLFHQAQTGSMQTPFKHFGFKPYATDHFTDYWYPIMEIGGVAKANRFGALNVEREQEQLVLRFSALQAIDDPLVVYVGGQEVAHFETGLQPLQVGQYRLEVPDGSQPVRVVLGNDGKLVWQSETDTDDLGRPMHKNRHIDPESAHGLYLEGVHLIYQKRYSEAYEALSRSIDADDTWPSARNHVAGLYLNRGQFEQALSHLRVSLEIDTYDPMANFLFGLASRSLGRMNDARDGLYVAALSPSWRVAARTELARLYLIENRTERADHYTSEVLAGNASHQQALELAAVTARLQGQQHRAAEYQSRLEHGAPLNHLARAERMLQTGHAADRRRFSEMIRTELSQETFLETALFYAGLNLPGDAVQVLEQAPQEPMVSLWLWHLYNKKGDFEQAETHFQNFEQGSPIGVLPFRTESLPLLQAAAERSTDWKPAWYLGLLNWALDRRDEARELFATLAEEPDFHGFYLSRARLMQGVDGYNAEDDLRAALRYGQHDYRSSVALINELSARGRVQEALQVAEQALERFPESDPVNYLHAKILMINGAYETALERLLAMELLPYEDARYARITYRETAVMQSLQLLRSEDYEQALHTVDLARLYPENLGVGRPNRVDARLEDFASAVILRQANREEEANAYLQAVIDHEYDQGVLSDAGLLRIPALQLLGRTSEAEALLQQWRQMHANDPRLAWAQALYRGDRQAAARAETRIPVPAGMQHLAAEYTGSERKLIAELIGASAQ